MPKEGYGASTDSIINGRGSKKKTISFPNEIWGKEKRNKTARVNAVK